MKNLFLCSVCHNGLLGGGLYLDGQALTFRTGKLTVSEQYRNLSLPRKDIQSLTWQGRLFPRACFSMKDGRAYRFLIFPKRAFEKAFGEGGRGA